MKLKTTKTSSPSSIRASSPIPGGRRIGDGVEIPVGKEVETTIGEKVEITTGKNRRGQRGIESEGRGKINRTSGGVESHRNGTFPEDNGFLKMP
jgi:hypothetical protein